MPGSRKHGGTCAFTAGMLLGCCAAAAQTGGAAPDETRLDEIVVTAQKREQTLKDVPISVDVVGGDRLERLDIVHFQELASYVPNLVIKETPGNNAIYIRGIGSSPGTLALEQSVSLFVDGVYAGRGRQFQQPFLDLERIEVLYGPQGGLVGKNTSAGAINVITRRPTAEADNSVTAAYDFELESYDVTAILSGPLGERFSARLAAKYTDLGGFVTNPGPAYGGDEFPQEQNTSVRLTGLWQATDDVEVALKLGYSEFNQDGNAYETLGPTQANGPDDLDHDNASDTLAGGTDFDDTTAQNATLTIDWDLASDYHLTAITGYSDYDMEKLVDGDFTATRLFGARFFEEFDQLSQEIRLLSPTGGTFEYVLGLYYHQSDLMIDRETVYNLGVFNGESIRVFTQDNELFSAFAQGTWRVTDSVRLNGTLRYTDESKDAALRRRVIPRVPPTQLTSPIDDSRSESQVDPAVSLQWDVSESTTLYASYTQGSKGGGFEGESATTTPATFEFEDEQSESYEIGAKANFGNATLNVAIYRTEFEDLQVSTLESTPTGFQTVINNAATARASGVELNGALKAGPYVTLSLSAAYNDAEYTDFPNGPCVYPQLIPNCFADISGTPLPHAPEWSGNLGLQYRQPLGSVALLVDGAVVYKDDTYLSDDLDVRCQQDAHAKVDLRVGIEGGEGRWGVGVRGKNLTDEWTATHCFGTPSLSANGFRSYYVAPPRTIALEATFRF